MVTSSKTSNASVGRVHDALEVELEVVARLQRAAEEPPLELGALPGERIGHASRLIGDDVPARNRLQLQLANSEHAGTWSESNRFPDVAMKPERRTKPSVGVKPESILDTENSLSKKSLECCMSARHASGVPRTPGTEVPASQNVGSTLCSPMTSGKPRVDAGATLSAVDTRPRSLRHHRADVRPIEQIVLHAHDGGVGLIVAARSRVEEADRPRATLSIEARPAEYGHRVSIADADAPRVEELCLDSAAEREHAARFEKELTLFRKEEWEPREVDDLPSASTWAKSVLTVKSAVSVGETASLASTPVFPVAIDGAVRAPHRCRARARRRAPARTA